MKASALLFSIMFCEAKRHIRLRLQYIFFENVNQPARCHSEPVRTLAWESPMHNNHLTPEIATAALRPRDDKEVDS